MRFKRWMHRPLTIIKMETFRYAFVLMLYILTPSKFRLSSPSEMGLCQSSSSSKEEKPKFARIPDRFDSVEQVQNALRNAGLEACQLIVGIDFTKSNMWSGKHSFGGICFSLPF